MILAPSAAQMRRYSSTAASNLGSLFADANVTLTRFSATSPTTEHPARTSAAASRFGVTQPLALLFLDRHYTLSFSRRFGNVSGPAPHSRTSRSEKLLDPADEWRSRRRARWYRCQWCCPLFSDAANRRNPGRRCSSVRTQLSARGGSREETSDAPTQERRQSDRSMRPPLGPVLRACTRSPRFQTKAQVR